SLNVFRNETPIDVLCFGHVVLEKEGRRLPEAAVHREIGEPVRFLLQQLRGSSVAEVRGEGIVSIENETAFNDYVDWVRGTGRDEIVLCSQGQANWAVVRLLELLHAAAPGLPLFHWGDLDRSGVLILRSLRRRTKIDVAPLWMDPETFSRHLQVGLPLEKEEKVEIEGLLARSKGEIGSDLLSAILEAGCWVEQEAVAETVLMGKGDGGE
ncbi:MAG: DUF2220 domain-containing protein, partial [Planctomycetes bacterium]|nr:DUF2220 domain-containing protein [Planctomycetota bacterium]